MKKLFLNSLSITSAAAVVLVSVLSVNDAAAAGAAERSFNKAAGAEKAAQRGGKKGNPEKSFARLDTDESGTLTLDELTAQATAKAEKKFSHSDADEDGLLSFDEWVSPRATADYSDIIDDIVLCVEELKVESGDDSIIVPDPENYLTPQQKFDAIDSNSDSYLDLAEVQAKASAKAEQSFTRLDKDESGDVSLDEYTAIKQTSKATRHAIKSCIDELTVAEVFE
ncbi:hypothetical protein IC617_03590 [Neiella sp. HB171785]|uniref:EF-hand domain-containing protein n=1 Tax=Neiella litorisoli TaxID=2771431 RepID=A0A8J6UPI5_9GAMM|nr:hypothetical protein [Neiella litorisoli]MBD1388502.1 hypothetical protein [Neiella litorisoli]